jgi:hypothetical protein
MCKRGEESRIYEIFASSTVKDGTIRQGSKVRMLFILV